MYESTTLSTRMRHADDNGVKNTFWERSPRGGAKGSSDSFRNSLFYKNIVFMLGEEYNITKLLELK
jgi:hypothetical protein